MPSKVGDFTPTKLEYKYDRKVDNVRKRVDKCVKRLNSLVFILYFGECIRLWCLTRAVFAPSLK